MTDAPESIWLSAYDEGGTEYIRSDLMDELSAENERLRREVENLKVSAAGCQRIANVDVEALSRTGAVRVTEEMVEAAENMIIAHYEHPLKAWELSALLAALKAAMEAGG